MKKIIPCLFAIAALLSSCIGEDFVEEMAVFPLKFSISNAAASGIDSLLVGDSVVFQSSFFNSAGKEADIEVLWSSSRPEFARVDQNGKVVALSAGVTNITATAKNGLVDEQLVVVQQFERIELVSPVSSSLVIGDQLNLSARYYDRNNVLTNVNLDWSSSNVAVATVNSSGQVSALSVGSTTISASFNGISSNTITIDVLAVERIEITSTVSKIVVGEELSISGKYFDQTGTEVNIPLSWLSSNASVASIDGNGKLTGLTSGQTTITATGSGVTSNDLLIDVIDDTTIAVSISISSNGNTVDVGSSLNFTAVVRNINGNELNNQMIMWTSSDPSALSIDGNGLATGLVAGSSNVTASVGNIQSMAQNILVTNPVLSSRTGNFQSANGYTVNGSVELKLQPNNDLQLNFSSFSSSGSGNLFIYLANSANSVAGGIQLERLNFRNGSFSTPVPSNVSISDYDYVIIWCQGIGQSFGAARLN